MIARALESEIVFDGRAYRLNLAFDRVLRIFELQKDPLFDDRSKLFLSVEMLAGRRAAKLPLHKQAELFRAIFDGFIAGKGRTNDGPRILDFTQDAAFIYASFMQAYGINLIDQQGRLDWREFIALFQGLPEDTKIREVMSIRAREIPTPNKHNAKEIKALREAKAAYALEISEEEAKAEFQRGLNKLAAALTARAKGR